MLPSLCFTVYPLSLVLILKSLLCRMKQSCFHPTWKDNPGFSQPNTSKTLACRKVLPMVCSVRDGKMRCDMFALHKPNKQAISQLEMEEMAWNKRQDQNWMVLCEKRLEYKFGPLYKEATCFSPHNRWIWKLWYYRLSIKCKIHDWKTITSSLISVSAILPALRRQMFHSSLCLKLQIIAS